MSDLCNLNIEEFEKFNFNGLVCPCRILNVYDGDTCTAGINWNNKYIQLRLRLKGINSPEIKPSKKLANRDEIIKQAYLAKSKMIEYCTDVIPNNCQSKADCEEIMKKNTKILYVKMYNFDAFNRVVSELYLDQDFKISINKLMIDGGYAVKFTKYK